MQKHALTFMEFSMLLFLANNPAYTAAADKIPRFPVRPLFDGAGGLLRGEYQGNNRRTVHLLVCDNVDGIILPHSSKKP